MLSPIVIQFPSRIAATATDSYVLEDYVADFPTYDPVYVFYNISAADLEVVITRTLAIGVSDDPLLNGSFSKVLVDTIVPAGSVLRFEPEHKMLKNPTEYPQITHTVEITNNSVSEVIVQGLLSGRLWETLAVSPNRLPVIR